MDIKTMHNRVI